MPFCKNSPRSPRTAQRQSSRSNHLTAMEGREKELMERIETLERTPLAVAEHFAKLVAPGERRSAMRDYVLFGSGVVVSTAIGIVIQIFVK